MGASDASRPGAGWLTETVRERHRDVRRAGLRGGCNYCHASPLRRPTENDGSVTTIRFASEVVTVRAPTLVIWAEDDIALQVSLLDGLGALVPSMRLVRVRALPIGSFTNDPSWSRRRSNGNSQPDDYVRSAAKGRASSGRRRAA